ncbi:membrane protein insertion efficiency factor YidD [Haliangium sp.]|uniref:membrane protein insertion efficiency factor YidD n=1 Tax=Haliangium sp. TaxID=2663208 RepID=UPI003D0DB4B5
MLTRALIAVIRFYQRYLSPLKSRPTCRYLPTCSSYALEAIERRGVARGTLMAIWRILRCNPLFPGGFDPVEPHRHPPRRLAGAVEASPAAAEGGAQPRSSM